MSYFTPIHVIVLLILICLFGFLVYLSFKQKDQKLLLAMVFANLLVFIFLSVFGMLVLDKYTKKAKIENLKHKRVLRNESIVFGGQIRNIGSFSISKCKLEIKLVSNPVSSKSLQGSDVFSPTTGFNLGKSDEKKSTISKTFVIARNLKPKELRNFSFYFKYPPHLRRPSVYNYLTCR